MRVGGAQDVFDAGLGEGVEAAAEIGRRVFGEWSAEEGVAGVVVLGGVDACAGGLVGCYCQGAVYESSLLTAGGHVRQVYASFVAQFC